MHIKNNQLLNHLNSFRFCSATTGYSSLLKFYKNYYQEN
jgi:hypothetical protein